MPVYEVSMSDGTTRDVEAASEAEAMQRVGGPAPAAASAPEGAAEEAPASPYPTFEDHQQAFTDLISRHTDPKKGWKPPKVDAMARRYASQMQAAYRRMAADGAEPGTELWARKEAAALSWVFSRMQSEDNVNVGNPLATPENGIIRLGEQEPAAATGSPAQRRAAIGQGVAYVDGVRDAAAEQDTAENYRPLVEASPAVQRYRRDSNTAAAVYNRARELAPPGLRLPAMPAMEPTARMRRGQLVEHARAAEDYEQATRPGALARAAISLSSPMALAANSAPAIVRGIDGAMRAGDRAILRGEETKREALRRAGAWWRNATRPLAIPVDPSPTRRPAPTPRKR